MRNLEKFESKISILTIFSHRDFLFSKLKQFLRTCSPIAKNYIWSNFSRWEEIFRRFVEMSQHYTYTHVSLIEGAMEIFTTYTSAHISLLRVLGNRDSIWKTHPILDESQIRNSTIFIQIWSSSFNKECVFDVESWFLSTLSSKICSTMYVIKISMAPSIRETWHHHPKV